MKAKLFLSLLGCAVLFVGCETTDTAQGGNQEAKRRAAMEKQKQQQHDEADANLWSAQRSLIDRDGNPGRAY